MNLFITLITWLSWCISPQPARAESSAPGIHWGALSFPDQEPVFATGFSIFRFTEFNGEGERFNGIRETIGLDLITTSWTRHLSDSLEGWSTNLTFGIGPTRNQPSEFLQNDFIHDRLYGIPQVPVGKKRKSTDFTISGSITRWGELPGQRRVLFLGGGGQTGSLYHELFARGGFRRWSPVNTIEYLNGTHDSWVTNLFRPLRFSGMVRAGRIFTGAAFHDLANYSFAAQGSLSYGWYDEKTFRPLLEVEIGATIDSGMFKGDRGDSLEERFWTVAVRAHPFTFETWNDQLNSKDFGPTYGAKVMMDLSFLLPESWKGR
ncbi:MAG: hypothetical protein NPIRA06_14100 [Nitrospirales bacterium]|nr:MAG: hypothetical protein NPIRA06_14100 [Nitrospirales bacterium]